MMGETTGCAIALALIALFGFALYAMGAVVVGWL